MKITAKEAYELIMSPPYVTIARFKNLEDLFADQPENVVAKKLGRFIEVDNVDEFYQLFDKHFNDPNHLMYGHQRP